LEGRLGLERERVVGFGVGREKCLAFKIKVFIFSPALDEEEKLFCELSFGSPAQAAHATAQSPRSACIAQINSLGQGYANSSSPLSPTLSPETLHFLGLILVLGLPATQISTPIIYTKLSYLFICCNLCDVYVQVSGQSANFNTNKILFKNLDKIVNLD